MKIYLSIYLYGAIIVLSGIFLLFSEYSSFDTLKFTLAISLIVGSVFSFISAFSSRRSHMAFSYHEMHALAMLVYGVSVLLLSKSLEMLISFTVYLFIFYAFSEIIFCLRIFELKSKVIFKVAVVRSILGLVVGAGSVVAMNFPDFTLEGLGILFIIVGINVMLYVPILKKKEFNEVQYVSKEI
jgi:uncharacterized membrane protein HdeD (DUF308 family)